MTGEQPIMDGFISLLTNNTNVTAFVASRIYDSMAPQNPTLPFLLVTVVSDPPQHYFAGEDILLQMQVDVFGKVEGGVRAVRQLGDTTYAALDRLNFTATGYTGISIMATDRGNNMDQDLIVGGRTQQDAWRQMQQYKIFGTGQP